jgi:hypothetical protein
VDVLALQILNALGLNGGAQYRERGGTWKTADVGNRSPE